MTIDIGANDVDTCIVNGVIDLRCAAAGEASIQKNVPKIAAQLRKAAGNDVPIIGMTYYDPFLAAWLQGTDGQTLCPASRRRLPRLSTA